ncbi:MAG TPA: hypothetical protein VFR81_20240, partial [Longimicrobium sp.]|nr:hypothetical protein [Longimicrobium sp.]
AANDYVKAQFAMTGGGTVTWGGPAGRLKWTARFVAIPVARPTAASGYVDIAMPTADIPGAQVFNGVARSANADGVVLNGGEALYAVHTPGGGNGAVTYRIVNELTAFSAPSSWLLVAAVNGDDGTVRLGTGEIVGRGSTLQRRLDTAEAAVAIVRAADFQLGHSTRRGTPGRALVDATRQLVLNYAGDWPDGVQVGGTLSVPGTLDFGQGIGQRVNLWGTGYGIGMQSSTAYLRTENNFAFYRGGAHSNTALDPGAGGSALMTLRVTGNVGIGTTEPRAKLEVAGAIMPAAGNTEAAGILFPPNPGGGGGDSAWMRYYARTGEATTLEIGVANDADDNIALISPGGVGIGTRTPRTALDLGTGVLSGAGMDYIQGQFTMTGGGHVTWGGMGGRLRWTTRFIAIPMGRPGTANGYVDILMPTADIPGAQVYSGTPRSANGDGVVLNAWEALYAVHTPGGGPAAVSYRIVHHNSDFNAPSNWLLVAAVNGDDNSVRLGTGETVGIGRALPFGKRRAREIVTARDSIRLGTEIVVGTTRIYQGAGWTQMPNMSLNFVGSGNPVLLLFKTGGVQTNPGNMNTRGWFRLLLDGAEVSVTAHEFHNNGWELRDVTLMHMQTVGPGNHTLAVQWQVEGGVLGACWYSDNRTLMAVEL